MKKLNLFAVTVILALVPFLQSCLDDDDAVYSDFTIATLRQIDDTDDYYFGLDSGRIYARIGRKSGFFGRSRR